MSRAQKTIFFVASIVAAMLVFSELIRWPKQADSETIHESIEKGLLYLAEHQLPYGEFSVYRCFDALAYECQFDSTPSATAVVLYALRNMKHELVEEIVERGLSFIQDEEREGVWRYWSSRNPMHLELAPDFDDISFISGVLNMYDTPHTDNWHLFEEYRNEQGAIYTWFREHGSDEVVPEVNANVLFYFALNDREDQRICSFVNEQIISETYADCEWCLTLGNGSRDIYFLYYNTARAFSVGSTCLERSKDMVIATILATQQGDGSFGTDYNTALALSALQLFGYYGDEVERGVRHVLQNQQKDGSWDHDIIWRDPGTYYRSRDMVTALSMEALMLYKAQSN